MGKGKDRALAGDLRTQSHLPLDDTRPIHKQSDGSAPHVLQFLRSGEAIESCRLGLCGLYLPTPYQGLVQ